MNPSLKLALIVLIALEVSFVQVWTVNVVLIVVSLLLMLINRVPWRRLLLLTIVPLFFAASNIATARESPEIIRFLCGNIYRCEPVCGAYSLTTQPCASISSRSPAWVEG